AARPLHPADVDRLRCPSRTEGHPPGGERLRRDGFRYRAPLPAQSMAAVDGPAALGFTGMTSSTMDCAWSATSSVAGGSPELSEMFTLRTITLVRRIRKFTEPSFVSPERTAWLWTVPSMALITSLGLALSTLLSSRRIPHVAVPGPAPLASDVRLKLMEKER